VFFNRTFHPDEANQAFTTGSLLETGVYVYKPTDHHGPTLYYAAAPLQKAFGHNDTVSLDGTLLRCTPLVFAVLAVLFAFFAIRKATGRILPALFSSVLLAAAPIFLFYSTDFIQEMLLACFSTMMLWSAIHYLSQSHNLPIPQSPNPPISQSHNPTISQSSTPRLKPGTWALFFGIAAGLAFATKETSVLTFATAFSAALAVRFISPPSASGQRPATNHLVLAILAFILTSVIFFSVFCADWRGVYNAFVAAPLSYFHRAAGEAAGGADWHVHPWWWYAKTLFAPNKICYSLAFLPLIVYPLFIHFRRSRLFAFLALHSLILFTLYSIIPYKTPWCMLQVALPLLLAYGVLLGDIAATLRGGRAVAAVAFILPFAMFIWGDASIYRDPDSRDIPYNYAHASPKVKDLAACVADAINNASRNQKSAADNATTAKPEAAPQKPETRNEKPETQPMPFIAVALPACDTWPFPWYNRSLAHITGYWNDFSSLESLARDGIKPSVVVCPAEEGHKVMPLFPHLNRTRRFEMRPRVRVRAFWSEP
jgi:uncharacterized protein (TIGR03663 family)